MTVQHESTVVRKRQIIAAARKLIVRYGSEHVTVRRIAHEIGVSEGAIYRHFTSKRDVLSFLVDDVEATLRADIKDSREATRGRDALSFLEEVIKNVNQRKGVNFQVIAEIISFGDKSLNKKVYEVINRYIELIKGILADGVAVGTLRSDLDLESAAVLFFGMMQGVVNIWTLSYYNFNLEQKYHNVWEVYRESIIRR